MNRDIFTNIDRNQYLHTNAFEHIHDVWVKEVLFTWRWWVGLALGVLPWLWWWFVFRKKDSTGRLLYAGYFVMAISVSLDVIGDQIGLWAYRFEVTPFIPAFVPWNSTLMPIVVMSLIQAKPHENPIYKAIFFSVTTAIIGEELAVQLGFYKMINWKHAYSIPFYFAIYIAASKLANTMAIAPIKK